MRRSSRVLVIAVLGGLLAATLGGVSSAAPAKKTKCAKGKVALQVNGKRTCVPAARFRQRATPPSSLTASSVQRTLAGGPIKLRLKTGKPAERPLPGSVVNAVTTQYVAGEAQLLASVQQALARTSAPTSRSHEIAFTGGSVTKSADGTSATGSIGFGGSVAGHTVTGKLDLGANVSGKMDIGLDLTVTDPTGASKTTGFAARDVFSRDQECPGTDGNLPVKNGHDVTARTEQTFGSKQVKLGTVRAATTTTAKSSAQVKFGPDGKAQPFAFTASATFDSSSSGQVLAFFQGRTRAVGSGTITGTLDPATGTISGATVTTKERTSGFDKGQAAADAELRSEIEKALNEEVGRLLDKVRKAEKGCGGFEVVFSIKTDANFATHSASGNIFAVLVAGKAGANEFKGTAAAPYEDVSYTSKTDCSYVGPVNNTLAFEATITVNPDGTLRVKWTAGSGLNSTSSVLCPGGPPPPPPIPGQPGPQLLQPTPAEFVLPAIGGTQAVSGGFQSGGDGWTHTGTIRVKRYGS
jgi:hypothetical protein